MDTLDFEVFWKLYPVRIKRMLAERAFEKLRGMVTMDQLLEGIKNLRAYMRDNPWYSAPHASTWLNQQRWTDEHEQDGADDFAMRAHKRAKIGISKYQ